MRPYLILATGFGLVIAAGALIVPAYAAAPNGDTITAPAGAMIAIQRDAKTGAYTIGVAPGQ